MSFFAVPLWHRKVLIPSTSCHFSSSSFPPLSFTYSAISRHERRMVMVQIVFSSHCFWQRDRGRLGLTPGYRLLDFPPLPSSPPRRRNLASCLFNLHVLDDPNSFSAVSFLALFSHATSGSCHVPPPETLDARLLASPTFFFSPLPFLLISRYCPVVRYLNLVLSFVHAVPTFLLPSSTIFPDG